MHLITWNVPQSSLSSHLVQHFISACDRDFPVTLMALHKDSCTWNWNAGCLFEFFYFLSR
jgi:hypothetical protein